MTDPYAVLGVSPTATDEEIKKAYRAMAKKYHPDNYQNSPLADLAAEKMKEVNAAYDEIQARRQGGGNQNAAYSAGAYSGTSSRPDLQAIREQINIGNILEAQRLCDAVAYTRRDAEWYYLRGIIFQNQGRFSNAAECYRNACNMDPQNMEYAQKYREIHNISAQYGAPQQPYNDSCSACDVCQGLICADCLCECCGGDLIRCC